MCEPLRTLPRDFKDPGLQTWQMDWAGWAAMHDPGGLWHANAFYPETHAAVVAVVLLVHRTALGCRLISADVLGGAAPRHSRWALAQPYFAVVATHPYVCRPPQEVAFYSPSAEGLLVPPARCPAEMGSGRRAASWSGPRCSSGCLRPGRSPASQSRPPHERALTASVAGLGIVREERADAAAFHLG